MAKETTISSAFPFQSKYIEANGANIHYIDEGEGDPIVFLHGVPTWSYLWRNIIPELTDVARCIAPDLIGMGKSDKPEIEYTIFDHIKYIESFIEQLDLHNITFVLHGWGSVIGFHYAMNHPDNVKGLVFYESQTRATLHWDMLSLPVQQFASLFSNSERSYRKVVQNNFFIDSLLPSGILRDLSEEELENYRKPYANEGDRRPLWQYVQELPIGGEGRDEVIALIRDYSDKLKESNIPKLLMYAVPGFITTIENVQWCKDNFPNLELYDLGEAMHFAQETQPKEFAKAIKSFYLRVTDTKQEPITV